MIKIELRFTRALYYKVMVVELNRRTKLENKLFEDEGCTIT
jgi:hypothetical protein